LKFCTKCFWKSCSE